MQRVSKILFPVAIGAVVLFGYNNCGTRGLDSEQSGASNSSSPSGFTFTMNAETVCAETEQSFYEKGFHQFLKSTCNTCHTSGPGKGTFGSPDVATSFAGFNQIGYDKISNFAVSNHNAPYTGSHNQQVVSNLRLQWQSYTLEKAKCGTSGADPLPEATSSQGPAFETPTENIPKLTRSVTTANINGTATEIITYSRKEFVWDLGTSLIQLGELSRPTLSGVKLQVTVTAYENSGGQTAYMFTLPKLTAGPGKSVRIKDLRIRLNGYVVNYATTFGFVDKSVYQGTTQLLSAGSLAAVGPLGDKDTVSVLIGSIEEIDLPAPAPVPNVDFETSAITIGSTQLGQNKAVSFRVKLSNPSENAVAVGVMTDATLKATNEELALDNIDGSLGRFNWDYKLDPSSSMNMIIPPGETVGEFKIIFSDDLRDDVNKVLYLRIGTPFGANLGSVSTMKISLPDYNSPAPVGEVTFSSLMATVPGVGAVGFLRVYCSRCHNKTDLQGNWELTDYDQMVKKGIIVPGNSDHTQHKIYQRINANYGDYIGLAKMPFDVDIPSEQLKLLEDWLRAGAKNN